MKIDEKVVRCFSHLRAPEFAPFLEYLKAEKQQALEMMAQVTDVDKIYRLQGKAGAVGDLISYVENAEALIAKFSANRKVG